jgi:aminoglycoside N3'-acetyltransferase
VVRLTLNTILEELQVPRAGVLYVQSSTDWLQKAGFSASDTLTALIDWTRGGTLIMPAYPFRVTHAEYLASRPRFDVNKTPAAIGLIPEVFRRTAGVRRSLDPDFSIAALGADAGDIVETAPGDEDPFGETSVYARLLKRDSTLLGLGVSLNTNSFIHVIDSRLSDRYPRPAYAGRFAADVADSSGAVTTVWRRALVPEFQQRTQPSAVVAASGPELEMFSSRTRREAMFFRWHLPRWSAWCDSHGRSAAEAGQWPCWLSRLGDAVPA